LTEYVTHDGTSQNYTANCTSRQFRVAINEGLTVSSWLLTSLCTGVMSLEHTDHTFAMTTTWTQ